MDTLYKIEDLLRLGYGVSFERDINQVVVSVYKLNKKNELIKEQSYLPFDHLYDEKIVSCLEFLENKVHKEVT